MHSTPFWQPNQGSGATTRSLSVRHFNPVHRLATGLHGLAAFRRVVAVAVETNVRALTNADVASTPRGSQARHEMVAELEAAGFVGITVLRQSGALAAISATAERAPELHDTEETESNGFRDEFVPEHLVVGDVVTCGAVARRWHRLGPNRVIYRERDGAILRSDFYGASYVLHLAQTRVVTLVIVLVSLGVVICVAFFADASELAQDVTNSMPSANELLSEIMLCIAFIAILSATFLAGQRKSRGVGAMIASQSSGSLPLLLPVLLAPTVPRFMVSYSWVGKFKTTARTLARAVPDCWLDTRHIVSPGHIPRASTSVATHCSGLLLLLTPSYLSSPNCCAEIVCAALFRPPSMFVTVALIEISSEGGFSPIDAARISNLLSRLGIPTVSTVPELLYFIDKHMLHASTTTELTRTVGWWRRYSKPRQRIAQGLELMSPQQRRVGKRILLCGPRVHGGGAVVAGCDHIAGDGSAVGRIRRITCQQKGALLAAVVGFLMFGLPFFFWINRNLPPLNAPGNHLRSVFYWCPNVVLAVVAFSVFQSSSGLDARHLHDPVLLPLNVAAYINEDSAAAELLGSFSVVLLRPRGDSLPSNVVALLASLRTFLTDVGIGIPCAEEALADVSRRVVVASATLTAAVRDAAAAKTTADEIYSHARAAAAAASAMRAASRSTSENRSDVAASLERSRLALLSPSGGLSPVSASKGGTFDSKSRGELTRVHEIVVTGAHLAVLRARSAIAARSLRRARTNAASRGANGVRPLSLYVWFLLDAASVEAWAAAVRADAERLNVCSGSAVGGRGSMDRGKFDANVGSTAPGSLLSQSVIIASVEALRMQTTPPLGQHLCLVLGSKHGIDSDSPYDSLVKAVLDSLGRKVCAPGRCV